MKMIVDCDLPSGPFISLIYIMILLSLYCWKSWICKAPEKLWYRESSNSAGRVYMICSTGGLAFPHFFTGGPYIKFAGWDFSESTSIYFLFSLLRIHDLLYNVIWGMMHNSFVFVVMLVSWVHGTITVAVSLTKNQHFTIRCKNHETKKIDSGCKHWI